MSSHLKETFRSPGAAFTGGFARIGMKQMATSMNLYVPGEFRAAYPFMSNFAVGLGFSPILNIPRMMQLGRISGLTYPQVSSPPRNHYSRIRSIRNYRSDLQNEDNMQTEHLHSQICLSLSGVAILPSEWLVLHGTTDGFDDTVVIVKSITS